MWENNYRKTLIRNIILAVLIVVVIAVLAVAMITVRARNAEQDELLSAAYNQQKEEQAAARVESLAPVEDEYALDMQTVAEYLPGIVCWGDSFTSGSSGNVSYPYVLQKYIDAYICDIYDLRSAIENAEDYTTAKWEKYTLDIPVVNMGAGPETSSTVLGRCGAVPYVTAEDFVIPAGTEPVEIKIISQNGSEVSPLTGGNAGVNNVTINGVEGVLSLNSEVYSIYNTKQYSFARLEAGNEMPVPAGTEIITAGASMYKDYIHVICVGTYDTWTTADELVNRVKAIVARQTQNSDRYIVLGLCSYSGMFDSVTFTLDAVDTAMMQAFGNRYINVRQYLQDDGLSDAKISPTTLDRQNIDNRSIPSSFRGVKSGELNGKAYTLVGKLVYDRMNALGYFDEVINELQIEQTRNKLLKEDPNYLKNLINNSLNW